MTKKFFEEKRPHNGLKYHEYFEYFKSKAEDLPDKNNSDNHTKLNFQRISRIHKTYKVDKELKKIVRSIKSPQLWMILTEDWCGDSAQILPHIAIISEQNPLIDLRILLRDKNLDIMDQYLTNGTSRSIPKLVVFDTEGNELFQWGPRPKEAQDIILNAKAKGDSKEEFMKKLHLWYARDKGHAIESEFKEILVKYCY